MKYKVGLDFVPEPNSLLIFDEADRFLLKDSARFNKLINGCFCICFTATPDNCDAKGVQRLVLDTLQFSRYNYVLDVPVNEVPELEMDVVDAPSTEEKVDHIMRQLNNGPVLTFCDESLAD